jgi:hypothetical protein
VRVKILFSQPTKIPDLDCANIQEEIEENPKSILGLVVSCTNPLTLTTLNSIVRWTTNVILAYVSISRTTEKDPSPIH